LDHNIIVQKTPKQCLWPIQMRPNGWRLAFRAFGLLTPGGPCLARNELSQNAINRQHSFTDLSSQLHFPE
jgi:hypothetical protein